MGILAEQLDPVTIRAQSPDKTVRASLTYHEGLLVRIKPGTIATSTPASLAEQIAETINRALRGFRTAGQTIFEREHGEAELERLRATAEGRALRPYLDALADLSAEATGARGTVTVVWKSNTCSVTVHEHAMFASETAVSEDINDAVTLAQAKYTVEAARLHSTLVEPHERRHGADT
ncbi:hypothetical protein [Stackebrandtia nassauensis]|uniref:Uncharacterized protein n=1 Tax=Stackebrandtia nassauensis (strain DSM 44728 / CIP 108903 / NRRL B-16338 / NBRC 102104 / LLR-40K-21) TaxID=446470 RepID=D3QAG5_STANL|nr:hypothetical protein [Stackebrandtia nassauensis]ADD42748.1 hypothetical protein Snas_3077 [Stackebrandtia nassauensis DSM 44728]